MRAIFLIPERGDFDRAAALEAVLTGLVALNVALMTRYRLPPLYKSGVRYAVAPGFWRHALDVLEQRQADCKSLSAYRAAELIRRGRDAKVVVHRTGPHTLHARVLVDGTRIEDPSLRLGMRRRAMRV